MNGKGYAGHPYKRPDVGDFLATGMHGGKIYIRLHDKKGEIEVPPYIKLTKKSGREILELSDYIQKFCQHFEDVNPAVLFDSTYAILEPNAEKPYKQTYCVN